MKRPSALAVGVVALGAHLLAHNWGLVRSASGRVARAYREAATSYPDPAMELCFGPRPSPDWMAQHGIKMPRCPAGLNLAALRSARRVER